MRIALLTALFAAAFTPPLTAAIKVDISPAMPRTDILTREWHNWLVADGPEATTRMGAVSATLRAAGSGATLTGVWWKGGLDGGATMATDGVAAKAGALELVLRGLPAGRHTVVTYHNAVADAHAGPIDIAVDGRTVARGVLPSRKVSDNEDAAFACFEVAAADGADVMIRFQGAAAVLNGFTIGAADPARTARRPTPAHADEHAPEDPTLRWSAAKTATAHHVYLGTDRTAVAAATPASPEFQGMHTAAAFTPRGLTSHAPYYWRIDTLHADRPEPTRGEVWRFRVRHLAFPGAEGHGRFAIGGRGGKVYEVTTLADGGPGSLRAAVEAEGPRTVVFRVGGTIRLKSKLVVKHPYLTVAGQTAPGDGVCLRGFTFGCLGTHDVILRHLRIRVGDEAGVTLDGTGFASSDHCIMDHCSVSWSIDEAFSSRSAKNITLQRSLIAEALNQAGHKKYAEGKGHSFAASISGDRGSFHHNLLAHCAGRNWSLAGGLNHSGRFAGQLDIRNNVVYNWAHRTTDGGAKAVNFVGNFYVPGPASKKLVFLQPDAGAPGDRQRYHVAGNVFEGRPEFDADNWRGVAADPKTLSEIRSDAPFFEPHVTTHSAREAYDSVLADVGATLPKQDVIDARILRDVRERTHSFVGSKQKLPGIIDSQADAGGWPEYKSGPAPADTDHDGMPDAWESKHGLNPANSADGAQDADGDGYTNLEECLNATDPRTRDE